MIEPTIGFIIGIPLIIIVSAIAGIMDWELPEGTSYAIIFIGLFIAMVLINRSGM